MLPRVGSGCPARTGRALETRAGEGVCRRPQGCGDEEEHVTVAFVLAERVALGGTLEDACGTVGSRERLINGIKKGKGNLRGVLSCHPCVNVPAFPNRLPSR